MNEPEPTEREVDQEVRLLVEELTAPPYRSNSLDVPTVRNHAVAKLWSQGYITEPYDRIYGQMRDGRQPFRGYRPFYLTPAGWDYWERLRLGPELYWLERNWFTVAIAIFTGITALVNAAVVLTR